MSPVDLPALQAWYRTAMGERRAELEALRPALTGNPDGATRRAVRAVGHALRASGGSFGFPKVTEVGGLLEDAGDDQQLRTLDGVLAALDAVVGSAAASGGSPGGRGRRHRWLAVAAGLPAGSHAALPDDASRAWEVVAGMAGVSPDQVAERVAGYYGLSTPAADERPTRGALRLVPEAVVRDHRVVPLREDGVGIHVALSDPTDLGLESVLRRLTGRKPALLVAPPAWIDQRLAELEGPALATAPSLRTDVGAARILVADDDATHRLIARATLERRGFHVTEAEDGQGVLDRLDGSDGFDLVIVDLDMPGMGGREVVRAMRAPPRSLRTPVVVVTGADDPVLEADLIEDGADDYIQKPLDPRLFLARVAATLRRAGP